MKTFIGYYGDEKAGKISFCTASGKSWFIGVGRFIGNSGDWYLGITFYKVAIMIKL